MEQVKVKHPAKFSQPILDAIRRVLPVYCPTGPLVPAVVLDPFAGVGRVHELRADGYRTIGVELEPEWSGQGDGTLVGDSRRLRQVLANAPGTPWDNASQQVLVDAIVTSPCYGNRMADTYAGESVCPTCKGIGRVEALAELEGDQVACGTKACERCEGSGQIAPTTRHTYRLYLGRELTDGNAGGLQWGDEYRQLHRQVWRECTKVLRPGGVLLLNISDHVRDDLPQPVTMWHSTTLTEYGFRLLAWTPIRTKRNKMGSDGSRDKRPDVEWLLTFRWPS